MRTTLAVLAALAVAGPARAGTPAIVSGSAGRAALDGAWTYRADPADRGLAAGYAQGAFGGRAVRVPYVPNAGAVTGEPGRASYQGSVGWYRTTFAVRSAGRYAIRFESVNHRADVWIDGVRRARHVGTYLPFEARARLTAGTHTVVVRADWRSPRRMQAEGFHRTWFNYGGVDREVTVRPLGATEVQSTALTTRLRGNDAVVRVSARVRLGDGEAVRAVALDGSLVNGMQKVAFTLARAAPLRPGVTATLRATVRVPDVVLWAPGSPSLYALDLTAGGAPLWHAVVGLRDLRFAGGDLRLNGAPLQLRGASLQEDVRGRGDALRGTDQDAIVAQLQAIGANATRSQHPLDEGLLERLDAAGIVVWQGVGPVDAPGGWTSTTPALQRRARDRVRTTVRQAQAHPSVIAWNVVNELRANGAPGGQVAYVRAMARELHGTDPGHMVAVDLWGKHPPATAGPVFADVDAVAVTNYLGWYQGDPFATDATLRAEIASFLARIRRTFPAKVLIVSEFGAEANARNAPDAPGGYAFQSRFERNHIETYRATAGLDGFLVWNLRDFAVAPSFAGGSIHRRVPGITLVKGVNQKGLFSWSGRPKPAVDEVRRLLARPAR